MLFITLPPREWYDDEEGFSTEPAIQVSMEHSLLAISRWEAKWKKPLISYLAKHGGELSAEELLDYFGHMIVSPPVYPNYESIISRFSPENIKTILEYLNDSQTATVIRDNTESKPKPKRLITAELVYCWMATSGLGKEYETWNINRLSTLINVISIEAGPKKKMSARDAAALQRQINERNRARYNTRG